MTILKSCCCFSNVRSGSIACGVYSVVLSIISAGIVAYNLHLYELTNPASHNSDLSDLTDNLSYHVPLNGSDVSDMPTGQSQKVFQTIFLCALVVHCMLLCTSVSLIIGISLDKKSLLVPWLSFMVINVFLDTGTMVYHTTLVSSLTYIIIEMAIWLLLTVLNIYCLLCVFSQYQELKAGRGTREHVRRDSNRINYHPGLQHVHINQGPIIINGVLPQSIQSTLQVGDTLPNSTPGQVTATLLVSAPDYNAASGEPPQYHDVTNEGQMTSNDHSNGNGHFIFPKDTLLPHLPQQSSKGDDSPPPPYSS